MKAYEVIDNQPDFIIIDKSPGISVHKDQQDLGLLQQMQTELGIEKLFLVHRLDKMTSGLLVLATNVAAASELSQAFADRTVDKSYIAISDRKPSKKQGLIKGDMVKSRGGSWRLTKNIVNPAVTRFYSVGFTQGLRLFLLKPITGRTHQLRVALKSIAAPIVGDDRYHNAAEAKRWDRGYLHAWQLTFEYQGQQYSYEQKPKYGTLFQKLQLDLFLDELREKSK